MAASDRKNASPLRLLLVADTHCAGLNRDSKPGRATMDRIVTWVSGKIGSNPGSLGYGNEYRTAGEVVDDLTELIDRYQNNVDQVLIAGDTTDMGSRGQAEMLRACLDNYGPDFITIVPGNHDMGSFLLDAARLSKPGKAFYSTLEHYMTSDTNGEDPRTRFPFLRIFKEKYLLIGLNTIDDVVPISPRGRFGGGQLRRLEEILSEPRYSGLVKIICMHHNPLVDSPLHYDFILDRNRFFRLLEKHAAESDTEMTVLFGHSHRKIIETGLAKNLNFVCVPMFAMKKDPDHLLVEISPEGILVEVE